MATSGSLEEHVTCGVCFEIYRDPQILRCLHTYCLPCIQQLQHYDKVQCPECRKYTYTTDIQKDFKVQSLIDLYGQQTKQVKSSTASLKTLCNICEEPDKKVTSECVDCGQYMCALCDENHREAHGIGNHKIMPLTGISRKLHVDLQKMRIELENTKSGICCKAKGIDQSVKDILSHQDEQFTKVKELKDAIISATERHHDEIVETIRLADEKHVDSLRNGREICDHSELQVQAKIDLIDDILRSKDISTHAETINSLHAGIKVETDEIKSKLTSIDLKVGAAPVYVEKGEVFKPEKFFSANKGTKNAPKETSFSYNYLVNSTYKRTIFMKLENRSNTYPQRLCFIHEKLWCAKNSKGIFVFDQSCKLETKIMHDQMKKVRGLTSSKNGDIFVACDDNYGLHQLDSSGVYVTQIAMGSYSDVCAYGNMIYALDYYGCRLNVFQLTDRIWKQYKIMLNYRNGHFCDKLVVNNAGIYVSSWENHQLYIYNLQGMFQYQTGRFGSNGAGQFTAPFLCDVDKWGNALVCDLAHHCLQVFDHSMYVWKIMTLQGDFQNARDAAVSLDGKTLWLVTNSGMLKYVQT